MVPQFLGRKEPSTITVPAGVWAPCLVVGRVVVGKLTISFERTVASGAPKRQRRRSLVIDMARVGVVVLNHMLLDSTFLVGIKDPHWATTGHVTQERW